MERKGFAPIAIILIVVAVAIVAGGFWYLGHNLAGGGGSDQNAPDSVQAGQPAVIKIDLSVWGGGGPVKGRYTDVAFYYRLVGSSTYAMLQTNPVPIVYTGDQAKFNGMHEEYTFTMPPYPANTSGSIEYYYEMKLDGTQNHLNGIKTIKIIPAGVANPTSSTNTTATLGNSNKSEGCILFPYTGKAPLIQVQYYSPGQQDLRGGMVCKFNINPQLSIFTLSFAGQADNTLGNITITEGTDAKAIQTIPNTTSYDATLTKAENTIVPVDANFDGYKDLPILNQCGATGNCTYAFYIYNPATNQFVENSFLSNLGTPSFDAAKKQVTTEWNSSYADWEADTYQYQNGQYALVQKIVSTSNGQNNIVTQQLFQLQNGKMTLINSTTTAGY